MIVRITRVKVGNRQAPQQHQKPHPTKGGVSAFTETPSTATSNIWAPKRPFRRIDKEPGLANRQVNASVSFSNIESRLSFCL
jgi:hypothetical protein